MNHYEKMFGKPMPVQIVESYDTMTVSEIQDQVFDMNAEEKSKFFDQLRAEGWEKQQIGLCYDDVLFRRANYLEAAE